MKPTKIIIKVANGIVILMLFILMFIDLEKNILYYHIMNSIWLLFNIEQYCKYIIEEKPNINASQMKLAKMPYTISIICLITVVFLEIPFFADVKHTTLLTVTAINALSLLYGYFLFKHLNKLAMD